MRKRADDVAETRQRIVEATVRLHGTVGPAATTVAAVADEAGVTRLTVYRHFPEPEDLFDACSTHWIGQQTSPNPRRWSEIADPVERLCVGLADIYRYYRDGQSMLERVYHDLAALPETHQRRLAERDVMFRDLLAEALPAPASRRDRTRRSSGMP